MNDSQNRFLLPVSILVAAILIAGSIVYSTGSKTPDQPSLADLSAAKGSLADDDVVLGNPNAPVTIVEFGDYQCPFCGRFFSAVEPLLRDQYVKTGKVKMVFRDFAFLGPESQSAALASQCAAEQGKFWVYHDKLFQSEILDGRENNGNLSVEFLKSLASDLGLKISQFGSCLDSQKYSAEIKKDYDDGIAAGVKGTPTTFINGKAVSGALSFKSYKSSIEQALAGAR